MKRSSDRDSPPPPSRSSKRTRGSVSRYDDDSSDERITPDRLRRRGGATGSRGRSPSPPPRARYNLSPPHRDEFMRPPVTHERSAYPYKVLCVSALHPKASDEVIKDTLYREYKKYGDLSIRLSHDLDERFAYVCFRNAEDARDAKHAKPRVIIYDKVALVEAVYEMPSRSADVYRSAPRPRSISPEYDRHYYGSTRSPERLRAVDHRAYDRAYGPPPGMAVHRGAPADFGRRDALLATHHPAAVAHHPHDVYHMPGARGGPVLAAHHPQHMMAAAPMHHHHPGAGYGPPPMQRVPRPPMTGERGESKKDKFPNYLHHVQPEDDPLATRTLFSGNLEINITEEELRRIFGRYGVVEDIDIKRPPPGTGNAFAFVRFSTLDMAHRAKVELSGQYIGKFQCKIGYGKATPTTRIWVGGLGPWTSTTQLEREFDRFGAIKKIEYAKADIQAFILYDSIDAATAAVKEMRGFPLGGPDKRLRTDFADVTPGGFRPKYPPTHDEANGPDYRRPGGEEYDDTDSSYRYNRGGRPPYPERPRAGSRGPYGTGAAGRFPEEDEWGRSRPAGATTEETYDRRRSGSRNDRSRSRSPRRSADSDSDGGSRRAGLLASSRTLPEVARKCTTIWQGALILKNSLFPAKFHLIDGDTDIVDGLMKDEDGKHQLRITQRLRLDQPKLEDVQKRISSATSHAIFLGLAGSTTTVTNDDANVQTRPLRNLVSYLKQKEAAGVISLLNKETEATGVLYSFPPCTFSNELIKRTCLNLPDEALKEDHLVIVVVRGGTA